MGRDLFRTNTGMGYSAFSPILGWNYGNEDEYTGSYHKIWGHYNTASNWCRNLPVIMAASDKMYPLPIHEIKKENIDFEDNSAFHSFCN